MLLNNLLDAVESSPGRTASRHKILFVTPGLRQGGAERQLLELVRRLPQRFEPVLCIFEAEEIHYQEYLAPGEPRHVLGTRKMTVAGLSKLARIIREEQPAIVHCHRDRANLWTRMAMHLHGVAVPILITSVRNRSIDPMNLLTESTFADFTDRVLCNSVGISEELQSRAKVPGDKLQVIHNFVDLTQFRPPLAGERATARRKFGLTPDDRVLALPGRISIQKHQLGLLAALHNLRKAGRLPANTRVLLAGRERDRAYGWLVRKLIDRLGLANHVHLLGTVTDVVALYHSADMVLMPSLYEGMPNAVIEAQACGLPVVVSRAANADDVVVAGETGFEVTTADRGSLAAALSQALALSDIELRSLGAHGRQRVMRMLDNDALLGKFTRLYDDLLVAKQLA